MHDGIAFRSTSLQDDEYYRASIWFDLVSGFSEPAAVRGEDITLPGKVGTVRGVWMPDHRIIEIAGFVRGVGESLSDRQEAWRQSTDTLMALMGFDDDPGTLELAPPYLGLSDGYSIEAVAINTMGGPIIGSMTFQAWSIQLKAYDPAWEPESS